MPTNRKIPLLMNILSLDVVLGAMAGMLFFSDLLKANIPGPAYLLLGMAVWSIYTLDHLWDAKSIKGMAHSPRHRFHQQNFKIISAVWIFIILLGLGIAVFSNELQILIFPGLVIGLIMLIWMTLIRYGGKKISWMKEFSTAGFYVMGIALVPFLFLEEENIPTKGFVFAFDYFLIAWINLLFLSYLDKDEDEKDGFNSVLNSINSRQLKNLIFILVSLLGIFLLIQFFVFPSYYHIHTGILLIILFIHTINFIHKRQEKTIIRQKLEASFMLPFVLIIL